MNEKPPADDLLSKGPISTYVVIGSRMDDDHLDYMKRDDVLLRCAERGVSVADTLKEIALPANVILQAHGGEDGTLEWGDEDDSKQYSEFFGDLPRKGICVAMIEGCYGDTALEQIKHAPDGTIILTSSNRTSSGLSSSQLLETEGYGITSAIDYYLETLDNFSPDYKALIKYNDKKNGTRSDRNPDHALAHRIGIGGEKGQVIDLDTHYREMARHPETMDMPAMERAVERVQEHFDTMDYRFNPKDKSMEYTYLGSKEEKQLDARIAKVADRLQHGHLPRNTTERRIALALTAAYIEESGALAHAVRMAGGTLHPDAVKDPKFDAAGYYIRAERNEAIPTQKNITKDEQAYLDSVHFRLKTDPNFTLQAGAICKTLTAALVKTDGNDVIDPQLQQTLQKAHISTRGWTP